MKIEEFETYKKAGEIAGKIRKFARELIKPGMKLVDIAEKIEEEIRKLGAEQAFPVNFCIDDVAAHYHPSLEEETLASGLLKIDIGIHIDGFIADSALTLDLTENKKHKKLIEASDEALALALDYLKKNPTLSEIGGIIKDSIEKKGFSPIINLSGHSLGKYIVHAGITIPNYANGNDRKLEDGAYAIEPFATTGEGKIYEGNSGNIYAVIEFKNPRSQKAREILDYVFKKYKTLPFSLREIQKKFGNFSRLALKELENSKIIKCYNQLIEKGHGFVSQSEHTFIKKDGKIFVTTRE